MPPSFSRLWTPRLQAFEDDQKIFQQEPFHTVFQRHQAVRESTRALDKLIAELHGFLRSAYWVGVSTDWVSYCLGDEIIAPSLYTQIRLFVIILWLRFRHRDNTFGVEEAQRLMLDAQMKWSRSIVPQISFVEDLAQPDEVHGEVSDGSELDSSNSESSDSEDDYIEQNDEAAPEESSTEGANDPYDIDEMSEDSDIEDSPVHHWYRAITSFFFPPTIRLEEPRIKKRVVAGLVQMRKLKRTVYNTPHFLREFEHSGLFFQLLEICRPGNLLETSHPDVELSFRFHSWRISYGEMLCRWTPPIRLQPLEITPKQPDHPFDPAKFLLFFSSNPRMHPWRSNPMAAYMFISLSAFKINCRHWLIPCLETLGFAAAGWNLEQVYRDIMRHPVMQTPQASETFLATLDLRLRTVITETALHRKLIKAVNEELFHPLKPSPPASVIPAIPSDTHNRPSMSKLAHNSASSSTASDVRINRRALQVLSDKTPLVRLNSSQRKNAKRREKDKAKKLPSIDVPDESPKTKWNSSCLGCAHKPEQDRCIRVIYVKENPIASRYIGCAITCAPVGDRLKPKCSTKGKKSRIYKRTYIHPADLALKFVEARASDHPVWTDCGRDIVRLIHIHKDGKEYLLRYSIWAAVLVFADDSIMICNLSSFPFPALDGTQPQCNPLTSEPVRNLKGKKCAAPEPSSDVEENAGPSTNAPAHLVFPRIYYCERFHRHVQKDSGGVNGGQGLGGGLADMTVVENLAHHSKDHNTCPREDSHSFLDADGLKRVLTFVPVASFASSILLSKDHHTLVIGALQLVDLLPAKVPELYKPTFRREGVFHEIESLSGRTIVTAAKSKDKEKEKEKEKETLESPAPPTSHRPQPQALRRRSLALRSRHRYRSSPRTRSPCVRASSSLNIFPATRRAQATGRLQRCSSCDGSEKDTIEALRKLAELFGAPHSSVSSFKLLQSGWWMACCMSLARRKELLLDAFAGRRTKVLGNAQTPFATFVKKLQESLTRMESFDVVTVAQGVDDSKRSSPSLLARQLRLRLVAGDESDVLRNLHNIVVSIHAITTFQALHDSHVAGLLGGGSRLSGMLAALAASGFNGSASRTPAEEAPPQPPIAPPPAAAESSSAGAAASGSTITRRRSQCLSAKNVPAADGTVSDAPVAGSSSDSAAGSSVEGGPPSNLIDSEMAADFTDEEEVDVEVFDDDVDPDNSISDKTVTLSIVEDGSKVEAQTPDGTQVATPSLKDRQPPQVPCAPTTRTSYASALKAKLTDWHLEFSMDGQTLPLDLTIYGAMHQHEMRKKTGALPPNLIWQGVYTVKFKKVPGPLPAADARPEGAEGSSKSRSPSPTLSSLPEDAPHAKILRLLRVLHQLNTLEAERSGFIGEKRNLPESAFVNNELTAKLTRQLEESMIVASSCLPDWALNLPQHFPFLFPFATRYNFLQSTSFEYACLILKWQSQQARIQDTSRRDEVEYFEEVGTGLGPTLEFYSLVSKEFARKDLKIWRDADAAGTGPYIDHPSGLYPAPINPQDVASDGGQKRTHIFRVIGQFVAKAMLDSRIIDLSLIKIFLKIVLGEEVPLTVATLKLVDISLANSLDKIQNIVSGRAPAESDKLVRRDPALFVSPRFFTTISPLHNPPVHLTVIAMNTPVDAHASRVFARETRPAELAADSDGSKTFFDQFDDRFRIQLDHMLHTATHETLIKARNAAYEHLDVCAQKYKKLIKDHKTLLANHSELQSRLQELYKAYLSLQASTVTAWQDARKSFEGVDGPSIIPVLHLGIIPADIPEPSQSGNLLPPNRDRPPSFLKTDNLLTMSEYVEPDSETESDSGRTHTRTFQIPDQNASPAELRAVELNLLLTLHAHERYQALKEMQTMLNAALQENKSLQGKVDQHEASKPGRKSNKSKSGGTMKGPNIDNHHSRLLNWGKSFAVLHDPWVKSVIFTEKVNPPLAPPADIFKTGSTLYTQHLTATLYDHIPEDAHKFVNAAKFSDFADNFIRQSNQQRSQAVLLVKDRLPTLLLQEKIIDQINPASLRCLLDASKLFMSKIPALMLRCILFGKASLENNGTRKPAGSTVGTMWQVVKLTPGSMAFVCTAVIFSIYWMMTDGKEDFDEIGQVSKISFRQLFLRFKLVLTAKAESTGIKKAVRFWHQIVFHGIPTGMSAEYTPTAEDDFEAEFEEAMAGLDLDDSRGEDAFGDNYADDSAPEEPQELSPVPAPRARAAVVPAPAVQEDDSEVEESISAPVRVPPVRPRRTVHFDTPEESDLTSLDSDDALELGSGPDSRRHPTNSTRPATAAEPGAAPPMAAATARPSRKTAGTVAVTADPPAIPIPRSTRAKKSKR
ncbi:hypothetical protein DFH09DRAFT_1287453 [Mycena vulgaris]|nr:hypothetical protein DFH09DRAFT_1287453 [Mycena vulgaris]